ncbi:MAG: Crp/Fnr family transcriptional regulator [Burkholderiaceae bacterium]|nr:Crp/Fnr family transcriptional regulator [Burkholderiaceae bacterium]
MGSRQMNVVSYLSDQALFNGMSATELARIAEASQVQHLPRGGELFEAGQACDGLYLVMDGQVKLYAKAANGHEKVIEVVGAGGSVAEARLFSDVAQSVNARVLSDAQILVIPKEVLVRAITQNPGFAMRMLTELARRLNGLVHDIEAVTLHSGIQRVVDYLLRSPALNGSDRTGHDVTVSLPASKGTIASLLSVTPEHFSRILHDLQSHGFISVQRRHIRILDAQGLARYA